MKMLSQTTRNVFKLWTIFILALCWSCTVHPPAEPEASKPGTSDDSSALPEINPKALKHFLDGEMLLLQGNYPMAILEFQDALVYDSSAPTILTSLANAYMKMGKFERAEGHLKEALSYAPKNREARELLGHQYLIRGQVDQAETHYRLLTDFYPEAREYRYILAEISLRKGELEKAQEQFWEIYEKDSLELRAVQRAAEIARERKDFPFALKAYGLLVKSDPDNIPFWRAYSALAVILQQFSKAISGLERLVELTSGDPEIRERLAIVHFDNDEMGRADSIFQDLYDEGHRSPGIYYYLSRIAMEREDYETVEFYSSEFVEKYPDEQSGYTNLAIAYISLEKTLNAISILLQARELFPDDFTINFLLGNSYNIEKNYILAKESLLLALNILPDNRSAKHLLASVYNFLEEWDLSDALYRDLLETEEDDIQALNNYSYTLAQRGIELDLALEMVQKAITQDPENPAYLDTIGWVYFKIEQYQKALQYIEKSIEIDQDNAVVLEHLGDVLLKIDRKEEAQKYYEKALKLDSDNERLLQKINEK